MIIETFTYYFLINSGFKSTKEKERNFLFLQFKAKPHKF